MKMRGKAPMIKKPPDKRASRGEIRNFEGDFSKKMEKSKARQK
jgi:hypothetical protein